MSKETDSLLEEAKERFKLAEEAWNANRKSAVEDFKFRLGEQWPSAIVNEREKEGRPCLVVDKLQQYIRQVVNDGRQNRPQVNVRPVDDNGDEEVAEVYQGIIRHIWDRSSADEATDTALDNAVTGGFGWIRVLTEYANESSFDQEISISRVRNPMTIMLDPNAVKADGSDAMWGFVIDEVTKKQFEKMYPNAKHTDWDADLKKYSEGWADGDNIRIVEYFYKVETEKKLHLLADGTTVDDELYQQAIAEGLTPPDILETRDISSYKVKWCKLTGAEILQEQDWPGKYIPIIPVYGNEYDIDGKVIYAGLIRSAKDAQRLYNYSRSAFAERVALTPKAPYVAADGQVDEYYDEWSTANSGNNSVLRYRPVSIDGTPVPPPQRQSASDIPAGFAQDMQLAEHDIQAAIGMYSASLGQQSNEKSGRAIMARQREGDVATFHYQDNLNRAIRYIGRILVDLIPKIYDSRRVVRILGEDGSQEVAQIDPMQQEPKKELGSKAIYNLGVGEYDVSVSAGPSYATKRQEAVEAMVQLSQANPQMFPLIGDLMVKNMDWPGADDIAKRLKAMLPPQVAQAEQKEGEEIPPQVRAIMDQASQQIQAMQQQMAEMDQAIQQREAVIMQMQQKIKSTEEAQEAEEKKLKIDAYNAETNRLKVLQTTMTPDQVQAIVVNTMQQLLTVPDISEPEEPEQPEGMEQDEAPQGAFFTPENLGEAATPQIDQQ